MPVFKSWRASPGYLYYPPVRSSTYKHSGSTPAARTHRRAHLVIAGCFCGYLASSTTLVALFIRRRCYILLRTLGMTLAGTRHASSRLAVVVGPFSCVFVIFLTIHFAFAPSPSILLEQLFPWVAANPALRPSSTRASSTIPMMTMGRRCLSRASRSPARSARSTSTWTSPSRATALTPSAAPSAAARSNSFFSSRSVTAGWGEILSHFPVTLRHSSHSVFTHSAFFSHFPFLLSAVFCIFWWAAVSVNARDPTSPVPFDALTGYHQPPSLLSPCLASRHSLRAGTSLCHSLFHAGAAARSIQRPSQAPLRRTRPAMLSRSPGSSLRGRATRRAAGRGRAFQAAALRHLLPLLAAAIRPI